MTRRYVAIWFRHLLTDWLTRQSPELTSKPFALCQAERGQVIIRAANPLALQSGIKPGMGFADARALLPSLLNVDFEPDRAEKILSSMAGWCIRYSPLVGLQGQDGLWIDMTGGSHLFGGEKKLLREMVLRFQSFGYATRAAIADTPGGAWAVARYGRHQPIIPPGTLKAALAPLPPMALRIPEETAVTLISLGIRRLSDIYAIPRPSLSRRFGASFILKLDQALGDMEEPLTSYQAPPDYASRLHFPDGVFTPESIEKVLHRLLDDLCVQMEAAQCGLRTGELQCFRLDGRTQMLSIGTGSPSSRHKHLFKLFEEKLGRLDPGPGFETFILSASKTDPMTATQDAMDMDAGCLFHDANVPELVDRLSSRLGSPSIYRMIPRESHWPERAEKKGGAMQEPSAESWPVDKERPVMLLARPEPIDVMAPVPDYPPMLFRRRGQLHRIRHADGPERIEAEWWLAKGELRDYYRLEDESGNRFWVFRKGHYKQEEKSAWFLHGFFA
jgi:protein ImuB